MQKLQQLQYKHSLHNSEQSLNILHHTHILLCHHSLSNKKKHLKSGIWCPYTLKEHYLRVKKPKPSTHHTSFLMTVREKRCFFNAQIHFSC